MIRHYRELVNLQRNTRNNWYRVIRNDAGLTQIMLYDEIGLFGTSASAFVDELNQIEGDIEVHINTEGGEVFDGLAIYNALKPRQPIITIDSLAASIGSVIAMAAGPGKLLIAKRASMMIHEAFGVVGGNSADMQKTANLLDKMSNTIAEIYAERAGSPSSVWRDAMKAETWYTADEAVDAKLADIIDDTAPPARNSAEPITNWDASAAYAKCSTPADFKSIAFEKNNDSDPATQAHYGLPHHTSPGSGPDKGGVSAAMGRWNQTQDLKNKAGALSHLKAHAKSLGLPSGDDSGSDWLDPTIILDAFKALEGSN